MVVAADGGVGLRDDEAAGGGWVGVVEAADGEDGDAVGAADVGLGEGLVGDGVGGLDFGGAEAVGNLEEVHLADGEEAAGEALGAVAIGEDDDVCADAAEDAAVDVGGGFGDNGADAEVFAVDGGHDGAFDVFADGDDDGVAGGEAGLFEGVDVGGVAFDGLGDVFGELLDFAAVGVHEEDFRALGREGLDEGFAEAA